jgi:hypothetical protein
MMADRTPRIVRRFEPRIRLLRKTRRAKILRKIGAVPEALIFDADEYVDWRDRLPTCCRCARAQAAGILEALFRLVLAAEGQPHP